MQPDYHVNVGQGRVESIVLQGCIVGADRGL
jgi:hypothetical protein